MYRAYKASIMSSQKGKSVIITGASSGIGETTAILFARKGANVTLCGQDTDRLHEAARKCQQAATSAGHTTSRFIEVAGDVTLASVREEILKKTVDTLGSIDSLIVNHGATFVGDSHDNLTQDAFDKTFNVNVKSAMFLIHSAIPHLEKTRGSVVVVSSFISQSTIQVAPIYQMSKAAVDHMVHCLALQHGPKGIRVNAVNPTLVPGTKIFREMIPDSSNLVPFNEAFEREVPLQGQKNTTEEQADVIAFMASEESRFISGQTLVVDGALSCKGNPFNFMR